LFLGTGVRVSECVGLNINDVDLENNAFLVTRKGGNQVVLYFPPEVAEALAEYLMEREKVEALPGHEEAFFLSMQKRRITQRAVQNLVKKYAAIAAPLKPRISPHKLRSTFATNLYNKTGDIYLVADVLGHSSVDTTRKHYADMTDARRRMAAEQVDLPTFDQASKEETNANEN
jgi:site-specific recombinase XerD